MEYNKVAAKWWAEKLRNLNPKNFDNGDKSGTGFLTMLLATKIASNVKPSAEKVEWFEEKLAEVIEEYIQENGSLKLSVDYQPDAVLSRAAIETGINLNVFPWKTTMWVERNSITVSDGYCAETRCIFPENVK